MEVTGACGLRPGTHPSATEYPFNSGNGLNFSGNGHGCISLSGEFRIFEIEMSGDNVTKLVADFIQRCSSAPPRLRGSIVYDISNSSLTYIAPVLNASSPIPSLPTQSAPVTVMKIESEAGDPIGKGQNYLFDQSNSTFTVDTYSGNNHGVKLSITSESLGNWSLSMTHGQLDSNPDRDQPLSRGVYENAFSAFFNHPAPGLKPLPRCTV